MHYIHYIIMLILKLLVFSPTTAAHRRGTLRTIPFPLRWSRDTNTRIMKPLRRTLQTKITIHTNHITPIRNHSHQHYHKQPYHHKKPDCTDSISVRLDRKSIPHQSHLPPDWTRPLPEIQELPLLQLAVLGSLEPLTGLQYLRLNHPPTISYKNYSFNTEAVFVEDSTFVSFYCWRDPAV